MNDNDCSTKDKICVFCEKRLPTVLVIIIIAICLIMKFNLLWFSNEYAEILTNSIIVILILIDILMTMMGFLLTVSGRIVVKNIFKLCIHKKILGYFIKPMICGLIIVIYSIILKAFFIINENNFEIINIAVSSIWLILCSYFLVSFIRIISLMYLILSKVFEETEKEEKETKEQEIQEKKDNCKYEFDNPDDYL